MTYQQTATTCPPFTVIGAQRPARWVITCDHASNFVPPEINGGCLGLPAADMARHIAYDIGADGVSTRLAELLNAPYVRSGFSRLVIDPNRGAQDPTLVMKLYDGSIIPANRNVDADERDRRLTSLHQPYHAAVSRLVDARAAPLICAIHSFTPRLKTGGQRPWHIGLLFADDQRLARPLLKQLHAQADLCVGENEPYGGYLPGDAIDRHALQNGHPNILIEIRNDLIETPAQQTAWAGRLAPMLTAALSESGL